MIPNISLAREVAECAAAAVKEALGLRFALDGDLALLSYGALQRRAETVTLTTTEKHNPERVTDLVAQALAQVGFEVRRPGSDDPRTRRELWFRPQQDNDTPGVLLTMARMAEYAPPVRLVGLDLPVTGMATLLMRALQQVQEPSRLDPRDVVDLNSQEQYWGVEALGKVIKRALDREAEAAPELDAAAPYHNLYQRLHRLVAVSPDRYALVGVRPERAEAIRREVYFLAERIARMAPTTDGPNSALLRRALLPSLDRAAIEAELTARGLDAVYRGDRRPPQPAALPGTPSRHRPPAAPHHQQGHPSVQPHASTGRPAASR